MQSYYIAPVLVFSPDSKILAIKFRDIAKLWDIENKKEIINLNAYSNQLGSIAFSPDSKILAFGR
jgi:WD40 repeat protein